MRTSKWVGLSLAALMAAPALTVAQTTTDPVRMDFEGLSVLTNGVKPDVAIGTFYSGGVSTLPGTTTVVSTGAVPGIGVVYDANALATETSAGGNGGLSSVYGLTRNLLLEDGSTILDSSALGTGVMYASPLGTVSLTFEAGFNNGVSFFFNSVSDLTVSVFGLDGSSIISSDFTFSGTALCPTGESRCEWAAVSLPFTGTAYAVSFSGVAGDFALDNVTLGQLDPLGALITGSSSSTSGGSSTSSSSSTSGGTSTSSSSSSSSSSSTSGGSTSSSSTCSGSGSSSGGWDGDIDPIPVEPIPEPSTYALMAVGLGLVGLMARRRRRQSAAGS